MDIYFILIWNYFDDKCKEFDLYTQDAAEEDNLAAWWHVKMAAVGGLWLTTGWFWCMRGGSLRTSKPLWILQLFCSRRVITIFIQSMIHYNNNRSRCIVQGIWLCFWRLQRMPRCRIYTLFATVLPRDKPLMAAGKMLKKRSAII